MSLFDLLDPPWNLVLSLAAIVVACVLILNAGWMAALGFDRPRIKIRSNAWPAFRLDLQKT
jgi:hypothetical protein